MGKVDFRSLSEGQVMIFQRMQAEHGDVVLEQFPTEWEANQYLKKHPELKGWVAYGLRWEGISKFFLRPGEGKPAHQTATVTRRAASGAPTAKSICLSVYAEGIERDAFVAAAVAKGVKEVTAKTMYSDIKAGRIK